ncbi:hypothetical protein [Burkholderia sp. BE17]|uniref:hypothetical protein n=1 Tax=Burkholderia sp. BE17 TaxID=2656644 RepID=UPI00128D83EE|nr:hypothetical protein [Burkholderia sp. BE17]MPV69067.1 hypothetical protein [Burkholderia sp. BE17]
MSLLKRMFDQFVRQRRNQRITRALLEEHRAAAVRLFDTDLDVLRKTFASTPTALQSTPLPNYPGAVWMGHIGINAFSVTQDIEVEHFPVYFNLVAAGNERLGRHWFGRSDATRTFFSSADRFSGKTISLLTSDVELICAVSAAKFNPPPPWIAWYELGPLIHNLQGDAQYWYENVWDRYWESLSLAEQDTFVEGRRSSTNAYLTATQREDWIESIRMRDKRYRER